MAETRGRIKQGDLAPDFTFKDQDNREVRLSNLQGKKVLLSFHPLAWTPVCTDQMGSLLSLAFMKNRGGSHRADASSS